MLVVFVFYRRIANVVSIIVTIETVVDDAIDKDARDLSKSSGNLL